MSKRGHHGVRNPKKAKQAAYGERRNKNRERDDYSYDQDDYEGYSFKRRDKRGKKW